MQVLKRCRKQGRTTTAVLSLTVLMIFGIAAPAQSQSQAADGQTGAVLEEIVVTARKREESIQRTPVSVTAWQAADLTARSLSDISQIDEFTPNMTFDSTAPISGSSSAASIFIRGVGQTDFVITKDPGVGVYLDGVYIARATGSVFDLLDIERIEVLRGPQGTLFGKNTIGGAINIILAKPGSELDARGEITYGRYDRADFRAAINVPLADNLFTRLSVGTKHRNGYVKRLLVGDRLGGIDQTFGRVAVRWLASDNFEANLSFDFSNANDDSPAAILRSTDVRTPNSPFSFGDPGTIFAGQAYNVLIGGGASAIFPFLPPLPADTTPYDRRFLTNSFFTTNATGPNGSEHEIYGLNLTLEWELGAFSIKSITGYRNLDTRFGRDPDGSPLTLVHTETIIKNEQWSEELQVSGTSFGDRLTWLIGFYYLNEKSKGRDFVPFAGETFNIYAANGVGCLGLPFCPNVFQVGAPLSDTSEPLSRTNNDSVAVFFDSTIQITERLALSGGLRWNDETRRVNALFKQGGLFTIENPRDKLSFNDVSVRAGLEYNWTDDLFTYFTFSQAFKSGGFNFRLATPGPATLPRPTRFDPEDVNSFEIGVKSEFWDRRVRLNLAGFFTNYRNIQVVVFDFGIPRTINAAKGRIKGVEAELIVVPDEHWLIQASYGFTDAEYTRLDTEVPGSFGFPIVNPLSLNTRFVNTPKHTFALGLEYAQPVADAGTLRVRGDLSYRSAWANDAINTPELIQDDIALINARATFEFGDGRWAISAFVTNLTNRRYFTSGVADSPGFGLAEINPARPREWGLSLSVDFGS